MSFLALVLTAKIVLTGCLIAGPFLVLSNASLEEKTGVAGGGETLFRLYGIAILALLVGYASGFRVIARGAFPWGIVIMGLVSNGGAAAFLFGTGAWGKAPSISIVVAAITAGLAVAATFPSFAIKRLW